MIKFPSDPFPELHTERLQLDRLSETDLPELFLHRSDPKNMRFIHRDLAKDISEINALFEKIQGAYENKEGIAWSVRLKERRELTGTIVFHNVKQEHFRAEIGYLLHHPWWSRGIASEAVAAVMKYGFGQLCLHTIEAVINPSNAASRRVLTKNGFVKEGFFKENYFYNGKFYDSEVYTAFHPQN